MSEWEKEFDERFMTHHYECEDSWYSCPKAEGGYAGDEDRNLCNCDVENLKPKIKDFIADTIKAERLALLERIENNMPYRMENIALHEVRKIKKELEAE